MPPPKKKKKKKKNEWIQLGKERHDFVIIYRAKTPGHTHTARDPDPILSTACEVAFSQWQG